MNFSYETEQSEILEMAMKFAQQEMIPKASEYDESGEFPKEIIQKCWELGLLNICIPEKFGGNGLSVFDGTLICEAMAYGCVGMATSMMANDLALLPVVLGGSDEQIEKFVTPFTRECLLASFCLTEPNHGSDAAGIKTTVTEVDNGYKLNGQKMWITNAGFADMYVVYATMDPKLKHKGICCLVVEKSTPGIVIGKHEDKMGQRCSDTRAISFENVIVPKENMIAKAPDGWKLAMKTLDHSRPLVASSAVGVAQRAFELATQYATERYQFDVPLSRHQIIQSMIANMAIKVEASRLLVQKSAWLLDQNQSNTTVASCAKAMAADACMEITTDAVQIYGGVGYSKEYPVEKLMRDAKLLQIYEGTSQIQRLVIAREVFSKYKS